MKKFLLLFLFLIACATEETKTPDFLTVFEKTQGKETATYHELIAYYTHLADVYPQINIKTIGETDSGYPLHLITYNPEMVFDFTELQKSKTLILINNGIHPGEPDGIDATMMLFRDLASSKIEAPKNVVLATIPVYNIGGALNRNPTSRTNQNGPEEYGFRGNARNYDLNRDFIKADTKNTKAFAGIFHLVKPDIFIDNHVSNGADYQYTLTHLFTQHNKLGGSLGHYLHEELMPQLESSLAKKDWDITPYVNVFNQVPEVGFSQFFDSPRYSTGYTTLWNTLGLMVETHMLKPYRQRVEGTYELMKSMMEIAEKDHQKIKQLHNKAFKELASAAKYPIQWELDSTKSSTLKFKGFEGTVIKSEVTGLNRLKYDRSKPFIKEIAYKNRFKPSKEITVPKTYVVPQGWWQVIDLLKLNDVKIKVLEKDTTIQVETYKIADYKTNTNPYEGHYMHYNTSVTPSTESISFRKGDVLVNTNQPSIRYIIETLEPEATDSFFNWNFFDTILQQKEGFSPYVFEDIAHQLLENDPELKQEFESKKKEDLKFAANWYAQLDWLHKRSVHYEKAHLRYPIYRILR